MSSSLVMPAMDSCCHGSTSNQLLRHLSHTLTQVGQLSFLLRYDQEKVRMVPPSVMQVIGKLSAVKFPDRS